MKAICHKGPISLESFMGIKNTEYYKKILGEGLLLVADEAMRDLRTSRPNEAPIHTSKHTHLWVEKNDMHALDWPARFSNPKIIEHDWS